MTPQIERLFRIMQCDRVMAKHHQQDADAARDIDMDKAF